MFRQITRGGANGAANPATLAYNRWLASEYKEQQDRYAALRRWYNGEHQVPLTDRQREYLAVDPLFDEFAVNYLRLPVELCVERLTIEGFDGPDGVGGKDGLIHEWWTSGRMAAITAQVHRAAARDGDTYVLIEWDEDEGRPVFWHEPAYDGAEGMKAHYLGNTRREMTMASKVWGENRFNERGQVQTIRRLNLYLPDRIEKYIDDGNAKGWQEFRENPTDAWPLENPLGIIPVTHFRWSDTGDNWGESEIAKLIPLQAAVNKLGLDELETADKTGAQVLTLSGAQWPADAPEVKAGSVLSVSAAEARWGSVPAGDLTQLRALAATYIERMAQISHIPMQYFNATGQIASSDTQRADDSQLTAKIESESVSLANAWEDAVYIALEMNGKYGDGRDLKRGESIKVVWADFERIDRLAQESRRAEILATMVGAGVSLPGALALAALGYTEEEQERMLQGDVVRGIEQ